MSHSNRERSADVAQEKNIVECFQALLQQLEAFPAEQIPQEDEEYDTGNMGKLMAVVVRGIIPRFH